MMLAIGIGKKESEYPEFDVPVGVDVADLREGDEKEIVATVRKKGDRLCLVEINGVALKEDEDEMVDEEENEEEYENQASSEATDAAEEDSLASRAQAAGLV